jgi:nucleoside 2-deoxyribosyltransferase
MTFELPDRSAESQSQYAVRDVEGVASADAVVIVMDHPTYAYRGTCTELGAALGLKKSVIMVSPEREAAFKSNVCWHHPSILHVKTWAGALAAVQLGALVMDGSEAAATAKTETAVADTVTGIHADAESEAAI